MQKQTAMAIVCVCGGGGVDFLSGPDFDICFYLCVICLCSSARVLSIVENI